MVSEGLANLMHGELMRPRERENLLILSGDAQPLEVLGMYALAGEILQALKEKGITDVITLAAYVGESNEKVLGAATDPKCAAALEGSNIPMLKSGAIGGLNGLLAGLAPIYGLRGVCLLGATSGSEPVDLSAAINLLAAINDLLSLNLDLSILEPALAQQEEEEAADIDMNYR
jgi:hypothetical protein